MVDDDFRRFDEGANGSKMGLAVHCCLAVILSCLVVVGVKTMWCPHSCESPDDWNNSTVMSGIVAMNWSCWVQVAAEQVVLVSLRA
jgi:hypothetical protein